MQNKIIGQFPSLWVATKRTDKDMDIHGLVTFKLVHGDTYNIYVHELVKFWEPCVKIKRQFWKVWASSDELIFGSND